MTDLELIALFTVSWIGAAAIWMILDWVSRPKHSRFVAKGDRIGRGPFAYHHFKKIRRAEEHEETRLLLEARYATPTLATSRKRRARVRLRHQAQPGVSIEDVAKRAWVELADSGGGLGEANVVRLESGQPAIRYNSILDVDEIMVVLPSGMAAWPSTALDPFASRRLADLGEEALDSPESNNTQNEQSAAEFASESSELEELRETG